MPRTRFIPPRRANGEIVHKARRCDHCGDVYWRRNLTEVWDTRNVGHRDGWHKTTVRLCMACLTARAAQRVLIVAHVSSAAPAPAKKSKVEEEEAR